MVCFALLDLESSHICITFRMEFGISSHLFPSTIHLSLLLSLVYLYPDMNAGTGTEGLTKIRELFQNQ